MISKPYLVEFRHALENCYAVACLVQRKCCTKAGQSTPYDEDMEWAWLCNL